MKLVTILGTRPELIRLCLIIKKLDQFCDQILVHTGQNYDANLNDIFIKDLGIRKMDYYLGAKGSFGEQMGTILSKIEEIFKAEKPDAFLVLGDTNSSLGALMAKRMGIRVFHMEAGNRCYDDRVPEETNRRLIDHNSDILLPYTERSRANLLKEGIEGERIYVTGNPIKEVLDNFQTQINSSKIMKKFKIQPKKYFLATLHRAENVDRPDRLKNFVGAFNKLVKRYQMPLIWSVHPHTKKSLDQRSYKLDKRIITSQPLGLFDFVNLEKNAYCVLSDSGTVQEECAIFKIPTVTLRDTTERPETLEVGSNFLSGSDPEKILLGVKIATSAGCRWQAPKEYLIDGVSDIVVKIVLGFWR